MKKRSILVIYILCGLILFEVGVYFLTHRDENEQLAQASRFSTVEDVTFSNDKINVYIFWGNGCPHCEKLLEFFDSISSTYGTYYNQYGFEVWKNENNSKLLEKFYDEFNELKSNRGVPYYIIGEKRMTGFNESLEAEIKSTILDQYKKRNIIDKYESVFSN